MCECGFVLVRVRVSLYVCRGGCPLGTQAIRRSSDELTAPLNVSMCELCRSLIGTGGGPGVSMLSETCRRVDLFDA